jgi:hypothetical protein
MDWLRDFQQSFREPVFGFLTAYWPVLSVIALMGLGWLFGSLVQRPRTGDNGDSIGGESDSDAGGDAGGGD